MNAAHLHLLLNHFPVVGAILALLLLAVSLALRDDRLVRAALGLTLLVALVTIPVVRSGHAAADVVEHMPGISGHRIETHEERAEKAAVATWIAGGAALLGLLAGRGGRSLPRGAGAATLALLAVANGLIAWTAKAGGEIAHPETRPGFVAPAAPPGETAGHRHSHGGHEHE